MWNDDAENLGGLAAQALCEGVGAVVPELGQFLDALLHFASYFGRGAQGSADGGYADTEFVRQVFQGGTSSGVRSFLIHKLIVFSLANLRIIYLNRKRLRCFFSKKGGFFRQNDLTLQQKIQNE